MINFPIKGQGLQVVDGTYSNGDIYYYLADKDGSTVAELTLLDIASKKSQAQYIAEAMQRAAEIGFEQGIESIRIALGVSK